MRIVVANHCVNCRSSFNTLWLILSRFVRVNRALGPSSMPQSILTRPHLSLDAVLLCIAAQEMTWLCPSCLHRRRVHLSWCWSTNPTPVHSPTQSISHWVCSFHVFKVRGDRMFIFPAPAELRELSKPVRVKKGKYGS